jgi:DNA helicase-2/ATP-dependent DNA helicase PcrA
MNRTPSPWLARIESPSDPGHLSRGTAAKRAAGERSRVRSGRGNQAGTLTAPPLVAADDPLLVALKAWRTTTAKAANVPAYVVFADATLEAVAHKRPKNRKALLALPGLGPVKAERYGDKLLELVQQHPADA